MGYQSLLFNSHKVSYLFNHSHDLRCILALNGVVNPSKTKGVEGCPLPLVRTNSTLYLGNFYLCHGI